MNPPARLHRAAAPEDGRTYSVMDITPAEAIGRLIRVDFPDARTVLDCTYGSGKFWDGAAPVRVTGTDIEPERAKDCVADFRRLPFPDAAFDLVVFDPRQLSDTSRRGTSVMGRRFGSFRTEAELQAAITAGCRESWRVSKLGVVVKVTDQIHAQKAVWQSRWVWDALPAEPYDFLMTRRRKLEDRKWVRQLSVWRNHSVYWVFRKDGPIHRPRGASATRAREPGGHRGGEPTTGAKGRRSAGER